MKFEEAVKEIQNNKNVRRKEWNKGLYITHEYGQIYNSKGSKFFIHLVDITADDWEVVDNDKDWNLAEQQTAIVIRRLTDYGVTGDIKPPESYEQTLVVPFREILGNDYLVKNDFFINSKNVKKCIDLILEDLRNENLIDKNGKSRTEIIINKRFGDLE